MYHEASIAPLSKKQTSRLLNGHAVRIAHGSHHKIHLSTEQHKKLHKAAQKGKGITVTLDPYAVNVNKGLHNVAGLFGKGQADTDAQRYAIDSAMEIGDAGKT